MRHLLRLRDAGSDTRPRFRNTPSLPGIANTRKLDICLRLGVDWVEGEENRSGATVATLEISKWLQQRRACYIRSWPPRLTPGSPSPNSPNRAAFTGVSPGWI